MTRDRIVGLGRRRGWGAAVVSLTGIVVIWWLLIAAVAAQTLPEAVASAPKAEAGLAVGQTARIHLPGLSWLPIPVERAAFDEAERGYRESDDAAIEHAFTAYEWIRVSHRDAVRVVMVDGEATQVEMLEGPAAGNRGWLKVRHLTP
jgi:hypothetical protein